MKDLSLPLSVRILLVPVGLLVLLIFLSIIGFRIAFDQITSLNQSLSENTKNENILKQKETLLSTVQNTAALSANLATSSLPGENSSLLLIYQLRKLAGTKGVSVSDIKVGTEGKDPTGLSSAAISFSISGNLQQILDFVSSIKTLAPITNLSELQLNISGTNITATLSTKAFWSPFPTKMPALTQAISDLNDSEKKVLSDLSNLSKPPFVTLAPSSAITNPNPFGQ